MPSKPRPKTFVAAVDFSAAGERYTQGDTVPRGPALRAALAHGDKFVIPKRKTKTTDKPTEPEPEDTQK